MSTLGAGIDLGTTNSCIAVLRDGKPFVVPNDLGEQTTPSVVSIRPEAPVIGKKARKFLLTHPAETFASVKRRMGERYTRNVAGADYTPESVSALILDHVKKNAERELGEPIRDVVITVPANFNSVQRQATKDAGEIAGLNVLRVINEPTAAALAYGHDKQLSAIMVVFDLGGGTFDISVLEASDGLYEVIHSHGDNHLGGEDFNMRIVGWIVDGFQKQSGHDIRRDVGAMQLVHEWAIAAKHGLTTNDQVRVKIPKLYGGAGFEGTLDIAACARLCEDLFQRIRSVARQVAEELDKPRYRESYPGVFDNGMAGCDILLVGGETRVRAVRKLVSDVFRGRIHTDVNPDEVVALGAAMQAGIIQQNPAVRDIVLVDTTALALGTEVKGGLFSKIIESNTTIPCTKTSEFTPVADFQRAVTIKIFQGESELCEKNVKLGEFEFLLTPPRRAVEATIELTYHLDANDILHVTAVDKKTGVKQDLTLKGSQNLDRDTVEKLRRQAAEGVDDDRARAAKIARWNELESFVSGIEQQLQTSTTSGKRRFAPELSKPIEDLKAALRSQDDARIEKAAAALAAAWKKHGQKVHAGASGAAANAAPDTAAGETVNCGNCGARLVPGFAFCGKCGVPLKKDACSGCGAALVEGFAFCGKCGTKV